MTYSKGKGTIDKNLESTAWVKIDGQECYVVRKVFTPTGKGDHISIPRRYYHSNGTSYKFADKDFFLVIIQQEIERGEYEGSLFYPDVYELRAFTTFNKKEEKIQKGATHGIKLPIRELFIHKTRTQEEAKAENKRALAEMEGGKSGTTRRAPSHKV